MKKSNTPKKTRTRTLSADKLRQAQGGGIGTSPGFYPPLPGFGG